ncbi:MAG: hypothetical protein J5J06_01380 [Phycisphaerae bacterium]|nr:hypothetical protein [Phycisphaerae bacterium]
MRRNAVVCGIIVVSALALFCRTTHACEVVVKNDSATDGSGATPCPCFLAGDSVAAWLTAPVAGELVAVQVLWKSQVGGATDRSVDAIRVHNGSTDPESFPEPQDVLATITFARLSDGMFNEFRYLDQAQTTPLRVPVSQGQALAIELQFLSSNSGQASAPSVSYDNDGCQTGANSIFSISQQLWTDACSQGVTGDWVIRAIINVSGVNPPQQLDTYPHGVSKQRYISFAPDTSHVNHAFRVRDVGSGQAYFISTPRTLPASVLGQGLTFLVSDVNPPLFDWTSLPQIHVGGCLIAPGDVDAALGRRYEVEATSDGVCFSPAIPVFTAARPTLFNARLWGDLVGPFSVAGNGSTTPPTPPGSWTPPDRSISGFDVFAVYQAATSFATAPHFTWTDVNPEPTDRVTIGPDVLRIVNAFGVGSGKEFYPYAYPQVPTTIHAPTPPSPALCPTPPLMAALLP